MTIPPALEQLVAHLCRLPGIGEKSAYRLAFHILSEPPEYAREFGRCLETVRERVLFCERCFNLAETTLCPICQDPRRDQMVVCVVESVQDLLALERARVFSGVYHVLHGTLSPLRGIGPDELRVAPLVVRARESGLSELILATNVDVEGEATAGYLAAAIRPMGVPVTRIAAGLPMGSELEFMDDVTLSRAFEGRKALGHIDRR